MNQAPLIILSGPSGSGKSTVVARVLAEARKPLHRAITATTRIPRDDERHGEHYWFLTRDEFEAMISADALLEWAKVHGRDYYGTPRSEVEPHRARGTGVILVIDVQGASQIRRRCPDATSIFLRTSSPALLGQRLRLRGTETEATIQRRLDSAEAELGRANEYTYQVLNDDLDSAVANVIQIVRAQFREAENAG